MKLSLALAPFLLLDRFAMSVSATDLITNTSGFVDAIRSADNNSRKQIHVSVNATIDFDDGTANVGPGGLSLSNRFFNATCIGYDETNKCKIQRSYGGGRFFKGISHSKKYFFTGFEFSGGVAPQDSTVLSGHGGVIAFADGGRHSKSISHFTDCAFINNTASGGGGALYVKKISSADALFGSSHPQASKVSLEGCTFDSNTATNSGGAIHVAAITDSSSSGTIELDIAQSSFSGNFANEGNDIYGTKTNNGGVVLTCTETTTSGTVDDDVNVVRHKGAPQTCYQPSSIPSAQPSSRPSSVPSAQPSSVPTAQPSSPPSTNPWETIVDDDFEDGWNGHFEKTHTSHKDKPEIINSNNDPDMLDFVHGGNKAVVLRRWGSIALSRKYDVQAYSKLRVVFYCYPHELEDGESLVVEYRSTNSSGGWHEQCEYGIGDFDNVFENDSYEQHSCEFNFTSTNSTKAKIRFRMKGTGVNDEVYIDDVSFEGYLG